MGRTNVPTPEEEHDAMVDQEAWQAAREGHPLPSPLPGDDDLQEGQLPFTAFGQFGIDMLDMRVFSQDTWWVDRLGRPHRLEAMSQDYRRNVLTFLLTSAEQRWLDEVTGEAITAVTDAIAGRASFAVMAHDAGAPRVADLDPHVWLESTPLIRRLRQLADSAPPVD
jgi:hypothetical protein